MRKLSIIATAVITLGSVITTFGGDSYAATGAKKTQQAGKVITVAYDQGNFSWPAFQEMANAYHVKTGNTVKFHYVAASAFEQYLQANFVAGTEPDIVFGGQPGNGPWLGKNAWYNNGWIINLAPYLNQVSPYTHQPWKDSFLPGVLNSAENTTNPHQAQLYGIPQELTTVNLYYNKNLLAKLGIKSPPATVTQLLLDCKKAKEAGYIGFSIMNSMSWNLGWYGANIWSTIWRHSSIYQHFNQAGQINPKEWAIAAKRGDITANSPELQVYVRFLKALAPYFNTGFNTASFEYEGLFNNGKALFELDGSWYPGQHLQEKLPVNYGVAAIPYLDKGFSKRFGDTKRVNYLSGATPDLSVTQNAVKDGNLSAAINFLRFWTDPTGGAKILTDKLYQIPVVKGVPAPKILQPIIDSFGTVPQIQFGANDFTQEQNANWFKEKQLLLAGQVTPKQFIDSFTQNLQQYADQAIQLNPQWHLQGLLK